MSDNDIFRFDTFLDSITSERETLKKANFIQNLIKKAADYMPKSEKGSKKKKYVFNFYFAEGVQKIEFLCNTDSISNRFNGLLFSENRINDNSGDYELCKHLFDPNVKIKDTKIKELYKLLFFVRVLSDYMVEKNDPSYYRYFNVEKDGNVLTDSAGKVADMYLLGVLFFKHELKGTKQISDTEYRERLFPGDSIKEQIKEYEHIEYTDKIKPEYFEKLIPVLKKDPLFGYLMQAEWFDSPGKVSLKFEDLKLILHHALRFSPEKGFYTLPVVEEIILHERTIASEYLNDVFYSSTAFTHFMGRIAREASVSNKRHSIKQSRFLKIISEEPEFGIEKGNTNAASKFITDAKWFNKYFEYSDASPEKDICFQNKITRLYYCANNIVQECSEFALFSTLLKCCEIDVGDGNRDISKKVYRKYDSLLLLPAIVLHLYPADKANKFLLYLAEERSQNYGARDRWKQIVSIAIISFAGLTENIRVDNKTREALFTASFGQNSYPFQASQAERLLQQKFYKTLLVNQINKIKENPKYAQPLFFFLYDNIFTAPNDPNPDSDSDSNPVTSAIKAKPDYLWNSEIMKKCFEFRAKTWNNTNIEASSEYEGWKTFIKTVMGNNPETPERPSALALLTPYNNEDRTLFPPVEETVADEAKKDKKVSEAEKAEVEKKKNDRFLDTIALYSIQAFLFAVFNFGRSSKKSFENLFDRDQENLITLAVYCDYYTRKINGLYQKIYRSGSEVTADEKKQLYLLCGPVRVSCLKRYDKKINVKLSDDMIDDYRRWYESETNRYRILLSRLLAYTDFFSKTKITQIVTMPVEQSQFLEYDNINADKVNQNPDNPLLWYETE